MRKTVLIAILTIGYLVIPFLIHAEVYEWIDDKGTVHFTDDYGKIPPFYRDQMEIEIRKEIQEEKIPLPAEKIPLRSKEKETRKDIYGQDKALWREKVRPWKKKLQEATENIESINRKISERLDEETGKHLTRTQYQMDLLYRRQLMEERSKYEAQVREANEVLSKIAKEAEEAKADPEWVK